MEEKKQIAEEISVFAVFINAYNYIIRKRKVFIAAFVFGIIMSVIDYTLLTKKTYKSDLLGYSSFLSDEVIADMIKELNKKLEEKEYTAIKEILEMDSAQIKKLVKIKVIPNKIIKRLNMEDNLIGFTIEAYVLDNDVLKPLEDGLKKYFNKNPFVVRRANLERMRYEKNIARCDSELTYLESIRRLYVSREGMNLSKSTMLVDPSHLSDDAVMIIDKKEKFVLELALLENDLNVVKPFVAYVKPWAPKVRFSVLTWMPISLIIGLIASFFIKNGGD
jgi:hypothetical protein